MMARRFQRARVGERSSSIDRVLKRRKSSSRCGDSKQSRGCGLLDFACPETNRGLKEEFPMADNSRAGGGNTFVRVYQFRCARNERHCRFQTTKVRRLNQLS